MFLFKKNSTSGRWFILQNTFEIIKDNHEGIGWNKFGLVYNLKQAEYFKKHSINDRTALLADNVEFALNEYLQVTAEFGLITGISFILFNLLTLWLAIKKYRSKPSSFLLAAIIGLTGVLTGCLTFYMLHCWWVLVFYLLCLWGIYTSFFINERRLKWIISIVLFVVIFPLSIGTLNENRFNSGLKDAVTLSINGYKKIADSIFNKLEQKRPKDPVRMFEYGKHLFLYGQTDSALFILNKAKKVISKSSLYVFLGDVHLSKQRLSEAEYHYKMALYIVPNRFISRKKLADFYKKTNKPYEEIYWLRTIMELPEKIPSDLTKLIKEQANNRLKELQIENR
jgi:tetratricopeptide (TPR) repeat protein